MAVNICCILILSIIFNVEADNATVRKFVENPFLRTGFWINYVNNNRHSTWKAGPNFDPNLSIKYVKALLGTLPPLDIKNLSQYYVKHRIKLFSSYQLPKFFDARSKWPSCRSVAHVRDQGECGSCWAVAAASVFGDRVCISSEGADNVLISAEEPLACCKSCGLGCNGGYVDEAWRFFKLHGAVTGGEYQSDEGCLPYSKAPCEHGIFGESQLKPCKVFDPMITPRCESKCTNSLYTVPFSDDHRKVDIAFVLPPDPKRIQIELYNNGPLQCVYEVYEDFLSYKSGVYKRINMPENIFLGLHSVKLIGWGTDQQSNTPYWLAMNSWNTNWGDNGTFKILRGRNNCNFESYIFGCN